MSKGLKILLSIAVPLLLIAAMAGVLYSSNTADKTDYSEIVKMIDRDEIKFLKRNCTKSLKKLFQEAKIDEVLRDSIPVLADEKGPVWVSGFGVAERSSIDKDSENIAVVRENK